MNEKKQISIKEVENGYILTYNMIGSGQQKEVIASTAARVEAQVKIWLEEEIEEQTKE